MDRQPGSLKFKFFSAIIQARIKAAIVRCRVIASRDTKRQNDGIAARYLFFVVKEIRIIGLPSTNDYIRASTDKAVSGIILVKIDPMLFQKCGSKAYERVAMRDERKVGEETLLIRAEDEKR